MLESQITQLSAGPSQRDKGKLPSQPEANPKEDVHAITLRSGRELETRQVEEKGEAVGKNDMSEPQVSEGERISTADTFENALKEPVYVPPPAYQPPLPFL